MEELEFPETTPARIVIKSNEKGTGFMRNHYHSEYCSPYINKRDFDNIVDKCSLIISGEYSRKRKLDTQGMNMCTKIFFLVGGLQILSFMIFALVYHWANHGRGFKIVTIVNGFLGFVCALGLMLYNFCRPYEETLTFEQMVFRKVSEYLSTVNDEWRSKNIEWVLIPRHYWMEMRMLDKNEADYDKEPVKYDPKYKGENTLQPPGNHSHDNGSNLFDDEDDDEEEED